jgi:rsbT co-antagonist protein RsbR
MIYNEHLDAQTTQQIVERYRIQDSQIEMIRGIGERVVPRIEELTDRFYDWLRTNDEFEEFLADEQTFQRVRQASQNYFQSFFERDIDDHYIRDRRSIGETHARIGLPLDIYFAAMNTFFTLICEIGAEGEAAKPLTQEEVQAVAHVIHLDTALVAQAYGRVVEETIGAQSKALMEMSTPVTLVWQGILLLPVVGIIDSKRAQDIMNAMLGSIATHQARNFILDISGVGVVDTAVANHLIKITKATALMGCHCIISGISPAIAQTIVELGIDVGTVETTANMRDALASAFGRVGLELRESSAS